MLDWDIATDVVIVGSGGGLCGAVTAAAAGLEVLVIEKQPLIGGSTAISGGILWLPNNPLMQAEGVSDSFDEAMAYFESVVGDAGPASSAARRAAFIAEGANMVRFLQDQGVSLVRCEAYSDYYAGVAGFAGGKARGRSIEATVFDGRELGPWLTKMPPSGTGGVVVMTREAARLQLAWRSLAGAKVAARVALRSAGARLKGEQRLANGRALIGQTLRVAIRQEVTLWTQTAFVDLLVENGRVAGLVANRHGRSLRIRARHGVLLSSGGFARNPEMRAKYSRQPNAAAWTVASAGDTGEVIEAAMQHGAAVDLMDEAWWIPASVTPDGLPAPLIPERSKPGSIIVDRAGRRYFNEAVSYMEAGRQMYIHDEDGGAIPSWLIIDSRHRSRYMFSMQPPLVTPNAWIASGYMKKADTLEGLARVCGIDAQGLVATVDRFNSFARTGTDPDFHRGEGAHEQYQGDVTNKPNACLAPLAKPPFYAVEVYPGDVGTSGGLLCDEFSRVLDADHRPLPGLYATGNCTASVMGRAYPGAGASIGASFVFAYIAMRHAAGSAAGNPDKLNAVS
jgi:3-oxosteroid 1-dehydrogenase